MVSADNVASLPSRLVDKLEVDGVVVTWIVVIGEVVFENVDADELASADLEMVGRAVEGSLTVT